MIEECIYYVIIIIKYKYYYKILIFYPVLFIHIKIIQQNRSILITYYIMVTYICSYFIKSYNNNVKIHREFHSYDG